MHVTERFLKCVASMPANRSKVYKTNRSSWQLTVCGNLIIVAQDTTYYGMDLYGEPPLRELLLELEEIKDALDSTDVFLSDVYRRDQVGANYIAE